jgi:hypothetical protein
VTTPPVLEADHWRIRSDATAAEGGTPVWETTEDQSAALSWNIGDTFRIRFVVSETGGNAANNEDMRLQYNPNSEGWADVGAIGDTTQDVIGSSSASSSIDNSVISTEILTAGQGSAATGGRYFDNGNTTPDANTDEPDANEFCEYEWGLVLANNVAADDSITFRLAFDSSPITVNYANVPTMTATVAAGASKGVYWHHLRRMKVKG